MVFPEIWKKIDMPSGLSDYSVSNYGRLKNKNGKILKPRKFTGTGYVSYRLQVEGKPVDYSAHRLVAFAFIPNPGNYDTVDHINKNRSDNSVINLRWFSSYHNRQGARALFWGIIDPNGEYHEVYSLNEFNNKIGLKKNYLSNVYRGLVKNTSWLVEKLEKTNETTICY